jgi:hypothetical protein
MVVLDKGQLNADLSIAWRLIALDEKPPRIAKHFGLNDKNPG